MSRIKRILLNAYLGITKDFVENETPYIRILGTNDLGRRVLRDTKEKQIITKPSNLKSKLFDACCMADDLYYLACKENFSGGYEYRATPIYFSNEV